MRGVLYFPFIDVPETAWFTRVLLYWDQVGTIVPGEYKRAPERLDPFTLQLVREGLVQQVMPDVERWREEAERPALDFKRFLDRLEPPSLTGVGRCSPIAT